MELLPISKEEVVAYLRRYDKDTLRSFCRSLYVEINEDSDAVVFTKGINDINWEKAWIENYLLAIRLLYLAFPIHHSDITTRINSNNFGIPITYLSFNYAGGTFRDLCRFLLYFGYDFTSQKLYDEMVAVLVRRTPMQNVHFWYVSQLRDLLDELLGLMISQGFIPYYIENLLPATKWINVRVQFIYNAFLRNITLFDLEKLRIKDLLV
jgi:hypothetical protein